MLSLANRFLLAFSSFRFFYIILRTLTITGITFPFIFHNFFISLAMSWYLSSFSNFFTFTFTLICWNDNMSTSWHVFFFFLLTKTSSCILVGLADLFLSQNLWEIGILFFKADSDLNMYHSSVWSMYSLYNSQWITFLI